MSTVHAVLGLLMEAPCHGYEIGAKLAERVGTGPYNSGQIHQALEMIERRGWAMAQADVLPGRARRQFTITPDGRTEFQAWLKRPILPSRPQRDEAVFRIAFMADDDRPRLITILEECKREYVRRLAVVQREALAEDAPNNLVGRLVRDKFRRQDEMEVKWIEHCLAELRASAEQAPGEMAESKRPFERRR